MAIQLLTHAEQVAAHLRSELLRGRWGEELPGVVRLGVELGVNHTTIGAALRLLEKEKFLVYRGAGRRRRIVVPDDIAPPSLRVAFMLYEQDDQRVDYVIDLQHRLIEAGHVVGFASKSLSDLRMNVRLIASLVRKMEVDAWVVMAGSREVLGWFADQPTPAFALAGRRRGVRIAGIGPDKAPALQAALRRLAGLGHRRIAMLARGERRRPSPGLLERTFLAELKSRGIPTGPYNLPDWEDSPEGLEHCITSLFRHTPPTALVIDQVAVFLSVERHLAQLGFLPPQHVSLICLDPSPDFKWFRPGVAHVNWDSRPLVNRMVRWADNVARGKDDRRQGFTKAEFVESGTIGPAPVRR